MPNKLTKSRGLTTSDARSTRRRTAAVVSTVVDEGELVAVSLEVPSGTVAEVVAWIGDDEARAEAAAVDTRKGVQTHIARLLG